MTIFYKYMIMKKNTFLYFSLLMLFTLSSCEKDFLSTDPKTNIPDAEAFSTSTKILAHVNNLYGQIQNPNFYGGRFIVFNEQRSDEFGQNDGNAATGSAIWNQNVASTSEYINNVWSAAYTAINASNILMSKLENTTVISDSLAKLYIGEAKFIRAFCYLSLVQTYAKPFNQDKSAPGVPMRLIPITSAGHNDLARSSVEEVYQQIIKDLDEAEAALPVAYSTALLNASRAHKSTAVALKTRVYLNMSAFDKVVVEAQKLVPSAPPFVYQSGSLSHQLETAISSVFSGTYTGPEAIFSVIFANTTTETPPAQFALAFNYVTQPIIFLAKEGIGYHPVFSDANDARSALTTINVAKHKILTKFRTTTAPFSDYVPVIRYAEVLLNYAEAAAQTGNLDLAKSLLLAVRQRSHANYQFQDTEVGTKESMLQTLMTERRIEFVGEGLRLQDLQRSVLALPAKTGTIGKAPEVLPTAKNYIWPIPSGELSTNKLCVPN